VTDLAVATGFNDATVSQALRLLRAHGVVAARDGRTMRYRFADPTFAAPLGELETS
jgi:ArsR family transcriptional regulator, lead/cadmium/zinc/bismuth-responsive transcriptional repressor